MPGVIRNLEKFLVQMVPK